MSSKYSDLAIHKVLGFYDLKFPMGPAVRCLEKGSV